MEATGQYGKGSLTMCILYGVFGRGGIKSDMVVVRDVCSSSLFFSSFLCQTALDYAFSESMLFLFIIVVAGIWLIAGSFGSLGIFYYSFALHASVSVLCMHASR
jgi:hypothetical protein